MALKKPRPALSHQGEYLGGGRWAGPPKAAPLRYKGRSSSLAKARAPTLAPKPQPVAKPAAPGGGLPPFKMPSSWDELWGGLKRFGQTVFGGKKPEAVTPEIQTAAEPAVGPETTGYKPKFGEIWGEDEEGFYYTHPQKDTGIKTYVPYIPSFYEDPSRVVRMHKYVKGLVPGEQLPEGMDAKQIEAAYKYLQFRNNFAPESEWKALNEADEGRQFLQGIGLPPNSWLLPQERRRFSRMEPEALDLQPEEQLSLEQANLAPWQKWTLEFLSSPLSQFAMGAVPGAFIGGGVAGPIGAVIGAAGMGGLSYAATKSPTIANLLMKLDWPAEQLERALGVSLQTLNSLQDPKKHGSLSELLADFPAAWKAAHLTYEVMPSWYQMFLAGPGGVKPGLGQTFPAVQHWMEGRGAPEDIPGGVPTAMGPGKHTIEEVNAWILAHGGRADQFMPQTYGTAEAMTEARRRIVAGEDPQAVYADMNDRYGFGALSNEMIGHIFADPLNVVGELAGPGVGIGAKLMGETDLARALLTPKHVLLRIGPVGVGGYPGLMEGLSTFGLQARTSSSVAARIMGSPILRSIAGITADGKINTQGSIFRKLPIIGALFNRTPESRVVEILGVSWDNLGTYLSRFNDPDEMVAAIRMLAENPVAAARQYGDYLGSPEMATIVGALRDNTAAADALLTLWRQSEPNRNLLNGAADFLGIRADDVLSALKDTGRRDLMAQRLLTRALELRTTGQDIPAWAAQVLNKAGMDPAGFRGQDLYDLLRVFVEDGGTAWHPQMFGAELLKTLEDGIERWALDAFDVKKTPAIIRLSNTMRAAQSLVLLGLNPTYLVNNFINNEVSMLATGVNKLYAPGEIERFWTRMGVTPFRLRAGFGPAAGGGEMPDFIAKLGEFYQPGLRLRERMQVPGALHNVDRAIHAASDKLGIFTRASRKIEQWASARAFTAGAQEFMRRFWQRGNGFHSMPPALEAALGGIDPNLPSLIYGTIEAGLNQTELEGKLWREVLRTNAESYIPDLARQFGMESADVADMLDKTGVLRYLADKLPAARTKEDVVRIFGDLDATVQANLLEMARTEYGARASAVTARVRSEGMAGLVDLFYDVETRTLHWREQHSARLTQMWEQADLISDPGRRAAVIRAGMDAAESDAVRTFSYQTAAYKGIVQALNDEGWAVPERLITSVDEMQNRWRGFFDLRREGQRKFFGTNWGDDAAGRARRQAAWEELQAELDRAYSQVAGHENDLTEEVNRALLEMAQKQLGDEAMERLAPGLRSVKDQLADMRAKMQDFVRSTRGMTRQERADAWRIRWAEDITDLRALIDAKFRVVRDAGFGTEPPTAPGVPPRVPPGVAPTGPAPTRLPPPVPGTPPQPELTAMQLGLAPGEAGYTPIPPRPGPGQAPPPGAPQPGAAAVPVTVPAGRPSPPPPMAAAAVAQPVTPRDQIAAIARANGVATATSTGTPNDYHTLAIVNRYQDVTPIERANLGLPDRFTSIDDVPPDIAARAFAARTRAKAGIARGQPELAGTPPPPARQWIEKAPDLPDDTRIYQNADGTWQPARTRMHEPFITGRKAAGNPVPEGKQPVAIVIVGPPGSGKSRVRRMMEMADAVVADADDPRSILPEYNAGVAQSAKNAAMIVHEEASYIAKRLRTEAMGERKNLVIDITGKNPESTMELLRSLHTRTNAAGQPDPYRVVVVGVWREREPLMKGILARAESEGRFVPQNVIDDSLRSIPANIDAYFREADDFSLIDFTDLARDREVWYGTKGRNDIITDGAWLQDWRARNVRAAEAAAAEQAGAPRYVEPGVGVPGAAVPPGGAGRPGVGPGRVRPPEPGAAAAQPVTRAAVLAREQIAPPPPPPPPPPLKPPKSLRPGGTTSAFGQDPTKRYDFQYAVVGLDELVTSNLPSGELNARYPKALQPRQRDRAAAMSQVQRIAGELEPDALLTDTHQIDRGTPIVGNLGVVESGNGRAMAMRIARDQVPDRWTAYQEKLRATLGDYGLKPEQLEGVKDPVLVRIHNAGSDAERLAFVEDANASATLRMAPSETAAADVLKVSDELVATLQIGEADTIERALARADNQILVKKFLEALPENERGELVDATGLLNARGMQRLKAALFAKTYTGEAGAALSRLFTESIEPGIKNLETAMYASLPRMAQAESLIRAGERVDALATGADIAAAVEKYSDLKAAGIAVGDFLDQSSMFGSELTPVQATILKWFSENNRSPKVLRDALNGYAQRVIDMPSTRQVGMFGEAPVSKEELWSAIINKQLLEVQEGTPLFAWGELAARTAAAPEAGAGLETAPGGLGALEGAGGAEGYRPPEALAGAAGAPGAAAEAGAPAVVPTERLELWSLEDLRLYLTPGGARTPEQIAQAEATAAQRILAAYPTEADALSDLALMESTGAHRFTGEGDPWQPGTPYGAGAVDEAMQLIREKPELNPWARAKQAEVADHLTGQFDAQAILMREVEKSWRPRDGEQVQFVDRDGNPQSGEVQTVFRMKALVGSAMDDEPTVVIRNARGEMDSVPLSKVRPFELTAEQVRAAGGLAAVIETSANGKKIWRVLDPRTQAETGLFMSEADAQARASEINRAIGGVPEEKLAPVVDPLIPAGAEPVVPEKPIDYEREDLAAAFRRRTPKQAERAAARHDREAREAIAAHKAEKTEAALAANHARYTKELEATNRMIAANTWKGEPATPKQMADLQDHRVYLEKLIASIEKKSPELAPARLTTITKAEVEAKPWLYTADQWQIAHNVEQPWIGEISPTQYARMGKQQKAAYDAKRSAQWQASADSKAAWQEAVLDAHKRGEFGLGDDGVSEAADRSVRWSLRQEGDEGLRVATETALAENTVQSIQEIERGQNLHSPVYGDVVVQKKNVKTVSVVTKGGGYPTSVGIKQLQYYRHEEIANAVKAGKIDELLAPIRERRAGVVIVPEVGKAPAGSPLAAIDALPEKVDSRIRWLIAHLESEPAPSQELIFRGHIDRGMANGIRSWFHQRTAYGGETLKLGGRGTGGRMPLYRTPRGLLIDSLPSTGSGRSWGYMLYVPEGGFMVRWDDVRGGVVSTWLPAAQYDPEFMAQVAAAYSRQAPEITKGPTTLFQLVDDASRLSAKDDGWWNAIGRDKPAGDMVRVYVARREGEPTEFVRAGDVVTFSRAQADTQAGASGRVIQATAALDDLAERPGGGAIWYAPRGQEALPGFEPVVGDTAAFFPTSTRLAFRGDVARAFSLTPAQADGILALTDARAGVWAKYTGRPADEWYQTHIAGVLTEEEARAFPTLVGKRGAVTQLDDGRAVILALQGNAFDTATHEVAHIFLKDLEGEDLMIAEEWAGVIDGKWTREQHEKWANGFLDYLAKGSAPSPKLAELFGRFKDWLREVYKAITGSEWQKEINPEIRSVFDRLISDEQSSSPAFLEWFAGSHAVDADTGRPMVLYHGTKTPGFEAFDPMKADPDALAGPAAAYLTTSPRVAGGVMEQAPDGTWRLKHAGYAMSIPTEIDPDLARQAGALIRESEEWQQKVGRYSSSTYLTDSEKMMAMRDLANFEETGNPHALNGLANQPYNMDVQGMLARAGVELEAGGVLPGWAATRRPFVWPATVTPEDAADLTRAVGAFVDEPDLIRQALQKEEELRGGITRQPVAGAITSSNYLENMQARLRGFLTETPEWMEQGGEKGGIAHLYGKSGRGSYESLYNELVAYCDDSKTLANAILEYAGFDSIVYEGGTRMGFESHMAVAIFRGDQFKSLYNPGRFDLYDQRMLWQDPPAAGPRVPGSTPEPWFESEVMGDGWNSRVLPLLGGLRDRMTGEGAQRTFSAAALPDDLQAQLRDYMGGVYGDLATTKLGAVRFGENRRDLSLLNYNKRTYGDVGVQAGLPYAFWYMHTPLNWMIRAVDRPAWLTSYARIRNLQENMVARPGWPTRLTDKMKIPMPFLPDWMGNGIYVDPLRQLFPWAQTTQPWDTAVNERRQIDTRAEYVVQKLEADGRITSAQARQALDTRAGEVWEMAKAQAANEVGSETSNPIDFISLMSSPALPISWAWNIIRNKGAKIGMLPPERLLYAFTGWNPGAAIREGMNKTFGWELPSVDRFHDYRVDRMLSNMVAEGLLDTQTATLAMVERSGQWFDMAEQRVRQQYMLGQLTPGFSADIFPIGEMEQRGLKSVFDRAYDAYTKGDKTALRQFFEKYPEYEARLALYDEPEERLRQYLVSSIWDNYTKLGSLHKQQAREQLGDYFELAFLNKETASPETLDIETLAAWAQALGALVPQAEGVPTVPSYMTQLQLAPPELAGRVDAYRAKRNEDYPNWFALQEAYYERPPGGSRRKFLTMFPELADYWTWRRGFIRDNPELEPYIKRQEASDAQSSAIPLDKFSPLLLNQIGRSIYAGEPLSSGAQAQLRYIWEQAGRPAGSFEAFLELYVYPTYRRGQAGAATIQ